MTRIEPIIFYGIDYENMKIIDSKKYRGVGRPRKTDYMKAPNTDFLKYHVYPKQKDDFEEKI